jgi:hypothetical protein
MKALPSGIPLPSGVKNLPNGNPLAGFAGTPKDLPSGALLGEYISLTLVSAASGYGDTFVNTMILRQSNPITDLASNTQFMAWDQQSPKTLITAKRVRNADKSWGAWTVDVTAITPTTAEDAHNYYSLAADGAGGFLISGDMHGVDMNYTHMAGGALHITAWDPVPIVAGATNEDTVTYPVFLPVPNGDVLFFWRDGASGEGNLVLTRWIKATDTVVAVLDVVVDGESTESFYPWRPEYDPIRDVVHVGGCWRLDTSVNTNHGLIHFMLEGPNFTTALKADGSAQAIPVTQANAAYAATDGINTGLTNVGSITIDSTTGYATLWSYTDPGDGFSQVYAQEYDGATWNRTFVPSVHQYANQIPFSLVNDGSSGPNYIPFSMHVALRQSGSQRFIQVGRSDTQGVGVWALIHENGSLAQPIWHQLDTTDVGVWFGAEDYNQWRANGELYFLHQFSKQPVDPNVGAQDVRILQWVPQEAPYSYTAPPPLFDPDTYPGCLFYLAPRVGGAQVRGVTGSNRTRIIGLKEARDDNVVGANLFVQGTASDAPEYIWNLYQSSPVGRAAVQSVATTQDFMLCTDAAILAALGGVNTPFAICQVVTPTDAVSSRFGAFGNSGDTTVYVDWGIDASGFFVFNRRVTGTEKRFTGDTAVVPGKDYVIWWIFDGTNGWIEANNVAQGSPVLFTFGPSFVTTQLSLFCRRRATNDLYASISQGNFVVYTTIPSLAQRQQVSVDLAAENGFSL